MNSSSSPDNTTRAQEGPSGKGHFLLLNLLKVKTTDERSKLCWTDRVNVLLQMSEELQRIHSQGAVYGPFGSPDILVREWERSDIFVAFQTRDVIRPETQTELEAQMCRDLFFFGILAFEILTYTSFAVLLKGKKSADAKKLPKLASYAKRSSKVATGWQIDMALEAELAESVEEEVRSTLAAHTSEENRSKEWLFSLQELCVQCCSVVSENRPSATSAWDWLDSIKEDLEALKEGDGGVPWVNWVSRLNIKSNQNAAELNFMDGDTSTTGDLEGDVDANDEGYDSEDSYMPPKPTRNLMDSQDDESIARNKRRSFSRLGSYLSQVADVQAAAEESDGVLSESDQQTEEEDHDERRKKRGISVREIQAQLAKRKHRQSRGNKRKSASNPKRVAQFKKVDVNTFGEFRDVWSKKREQYSGEGSHVVSPEAAAAKFDQQQRLSEDEAMTLLLRAEFILKLEPNVVKVDSCPATVIGDLHGQYFDFRNMMSLIGKPGTEGVGTLVFLGDYVDRGAFSCEVLFYLLALKVAHPKHMVLLRGNHECDAVSSYFGFKDEALNKYGTTIFHRCLKVFQAMPIAGVVTTPLGNIMCCHGGLSPHVTDLKDVESCDRFCEPGMNGLLCDLLWADPVRVTDQSDASHKHDNVDGSAREDQPEYFPNPARGCSYKFSQKALNKFLLKNKLVGIMRGHEVCETGFRYQFSTPSTFVLTVFSAPNYCDTYHNQGSFVKILPTGNLRREVIVPVQFAEVVHPVPREFESVTVKRRTAVEENCPYMPTTLVGFVKRASKFGQEFGSAKVRFIFGQFQQNPSHIQAPAGRVNQGSLNKNRASRASRASRRGSKRTNRRKGAKGGRKHGKSMVDDMVDDIEGGDDSQANPGSEQYQTAAAADSINEMHPQKVEERLEDATKRLINKHTERDVRYGEDVPGSGGGSDNRGRKSGGVKGGGNDGSPVGRMLNKMKKLSLPRNTDRKNFVVFKPGSMRDSQDWTVMLGVPEATVKAQRSRANSNVHFTKKKRQSGRARSRSSGAKRAVGGGNRVTLERTQFLQKQFMDLIPPLADWLSNMEAGDDAAKNNKITNNDIKNTSKTGGASSVINVATFCTDLADGVVLCRLVQLIPESGIKRFNVPAKGRTTLNEFQKRENVLEFQLACKRIGLRSSFGTAELNEWKLSSVVPCLVQLARIVQRSRKAIADQTSSLGGKGGSMLSSQGDVGSAMSDDEVDYSESDMAEGVEDEESDGGHGKKHGDNQGGESLVMSFTEKELLTLQLLFLMLDRDDDGQITVQDLMALSEEEGSFLAVRIAESVVEAIDADGDGTIGTSDFLRFAAHNKEIWEEGDDGERKKRLSARKVV